MDSSRIHDTKVIERDLKASDPNLRRQASIAREKILKEDSWTRSARESLIRETRKGRTDNATDIRESMVTHEGRKSGTSRTSFSFHLPWKK